MSGEAGRRRETVLIVVNPISGKGQGRAILPRVRRGVRSLGYAVDTVITRGAGDARRAVETANGVSAVVAVGGDGTINEVLNGLAGRRLPVAIYPAGTGNILGKELDLAASPQALVDLLRDRRVSWFDLVEVESATAPSTAGPSARFHRRFAAVAGIGFDASIVRELSSLREGSIHMAYYTIPILKVLATYDFPPLRLEVDGRVVSEGAGFAIVGNVASYGGPLRLVPRASSDDGLMDVCVFRKRSVWDFLRYGFGVLTRSHHRYPDVHFHQGREVRVSSESPRVPVQVDGDNAGFLPATFRVLPREVPILAPRKKGGPGGALEV
ncbi:MAG: diacylglycerol kinase family lipid kinase [Planctomycetes bacterium]|nr:diacylglycerol kinase family lipid kinase [Planctomycetota bacterium]